METVAQAAELAVAPEPAQQVHRCHPAGVRRPGEPGRSAAPREARMIGARKRNGSVPLTYAVRSSFEPSALSGEGMRGAGNLDGRHRRKAVAADSNPSSARGVGRAFERCGSDGPRMRFEPFQGRPSTGYRRRWERRWREGLTPGTTVMVSRCSGSHGIRTLVAALPN